MRRRRSNLHITQKRKREQRTLRMVGKVFLILLGCAFFLYLVRAAVVKIAAPSKEGADSYVTLQEAGNLVWLLADTAQKEETGVTKTGINSADPDAVLTLLKGLDPAEGEGYLTYGQAKQMLKLLPADSAGLPKGSDRRKVKAKEWYGWFDACRKLYDPEGRIQDMELAVLQTDGQRAVTGQGMWQCYADIFLDPQMLYRPVRAIAREDGLYAVRSVKQDSAFEITNVWIKGLTESEISCFYNDINMQLSYSGEETGVERQEAYETVADLAFRDGRLTGIRIKGDKVSGRLLKIADGKAEIEGQGEFSFADDWRGYRLYGQMKQLAMTDLRIGYAFTDFVLEDGRIVAALVPKEERMETIRALIKTSGYGGAYHDSVILLADCECTVRVSGPDGAYIKSLEAGEELTISKESDLFRDTDRIYITPDILTGHIFLENVDRAQGNPSYRGSLEFQRTPDGIVVINEVLLEEYLYAVVPSEMPASYPMEALKSQAVCARTYAFSKMCHAGLPAYGAHVDDSTSFQVYNNVEENAATTQAVRETKGEVLFYRDNPAEIYYYSTSCGFGTDAGVWSDDGAQNYPYMMAKKICPDEEGETFYEEEEPWYRWQYETTAIDPDVLNRAIQKRYETSPSSVLVMQADGSYLSQKPPFVSKIKEISIDEQRPGGAASALKIEGENAVILVKTEYGIRSVLCDTVTQVLRQDQTLVNAPVILPSAFFTISTFKKDGFVIGYSLSGGGYGHGVGMSQNGAKHMALYGKKAGEILDFFYEGCRIEDIYPE